MVNPVWDIPTRGLHWFYPLGIGLMWWTGETGRMELHGYVGYAIIVATTTRLIWGLVGSHHSRFSSFLRGPATVMSYVREGGDYLGHNPLGGLSTLALLSIVLFQGMTGLFNSDDIAFDGPLAFYFDGRYIDVAAQSHDIGWTLLQGFVLLHLAAIFWYQVIKRQPLIQTMWFGAFRDRVAAMAPVPVSRAVVVIVAVSAVLMAVINGAPEAPSYY